MLIVFRAPATTSRRIEISIFITVMPPVFQSYYTSALWTFFDTSTAVSLDFRNFATASIFSFILKKKEYVAFHFPLKNIFISFRCVGWATQQATVECQCAVTSSKSSTVNTAPISLKLSEETCQSEYQKAVASIEVIVKESRNLAL